MLKHLMSGASLLALAVRDNEDEGGSARDKARAELMKNNTVTAGDPPAKKEATADPDPKEEEDDDEENEDEEDENEEGDADSKVEETEEEKAEREAKEKQEAKAKRKADRMQARIDRVTAEKAAADQEIARLKAQLEADPDKKLTAEEVEAKAEAIAAKKLAEKEAADLQAKFEEACSKLQKEALKADAEFNDKIDDIAQQFGPIPSFMIGVLEDFENGGEVLAYIANDDDVAELIYSLKNRPAKMTKELVTISNKLIEAKKPKQKPLSRVPDPVKPVRGGNVQSLTITDADTKDMDKYVAKRRRQQEEARKARGY